MGLVLLTERYAGQIAGTLSCYDRLLFQGTLPGLCFAGGMTAYFYTHELRIFDYARWAEPLRDRIKQNAERLAAEAGLEIEYVRKKNFRKEDRVQEVLKQRGDHPGLVHVFSAMERCGTYRPWYDKAKGKTYFRPDSGKCLHYYFYFIDPELGLCYVRVPTWCPFRLQVYANGHNWLASKLKRQGIGFTLLDNAFTAVDDWVAAQQLADTVRADKVHHKLDAIAKRYCPVTGTLGIRYHWSIDQAEYATDIVFRRPGDLQAIYGHLTRTAIHTVKPDDIATFLGKRLQKTNRDEIGNRYNIRIEGTRIKHSMGPASIKMYDKFGQILRIETTINNLTFFPHYREVEQRDGRRVKKWAEMKKSIYSLPALRQVMAASNRRYIEFISAIDDPSAGVDRLDRISRTITQGDRSYRGLNFFSDQDQQLLEAVARGEHNINGLQNKTLRQHLPESSSGQISRLLKNLRVHGLIKRVGRTYKYYLTRTGKLVVAAGLKLKQFFLIPELATTLA